jgi:hypothetical protein
MIHVTSRSEKEGREKENAHVERGVHEKFRKNRSNCIGEMKIEDERAAEKEKKDLRERIKSITFQKRSQFAFACARKSALLSSGGVGIETT